MNNTKDMKIGKATVIFFNINSDNYTTNEKEIAIRMILDMPTHNGFTKDKILEVLDWLWIQNYKK